MNALSGVWKMLPCTMKGIVGACLDNALLSKTFKRVVSEIKQKVVKVAWVLGTHRTPIGRSFRTFSVTK